MVFLPIYSCLQQVQIGFIFKNHKSYAYTCVSTTFVTLLFERLDPLSVLFKHVNTQIALQVSTVQIYFLLPSRFLLSYLQVLIVKQIHLPFFYHAQIY